MEILKNNKTSFMKPVLILHILIYDSLFIENYII